MENTYGERWMLVGGLALALGAIVFVVAMHGSNSCPSSTNCHCCMADLSVQSLNVSDRAKLGSFSSNIVVDSHQGLITIRGPKDSVSLSFDDLARTLKQWKNRKSGVIIQEDND